MNFVTPKKEDRLFGGASVNVGIVVRLTDAATKGLRGIRSSISSLGGVAGKATKSVFSLQGAIVGLAAGAATSKIVQYADAWATTANRLKVVGVEGSKVVNTQEQLFKIAQQSRSPLDAVGSLYSRIAMSTTELNLSQAEMLELTDTIGKSFQVSGASAIEMEAAIMQLGQGMASGTLRGDELRSVLEQAPRLARAIAEGMGVPFGQLRKIASEGKITSAALVRALQSQGGQIREEFDLMEPTIGSMMTQVDNAFRRMVGTLNEQIKFTEPMKGAIQFIVDLLTTKIPAAFAAIPKLLDIMSRGFDIISDIASDFYEELTSNPMESFERMYTAFAHNAVNTFSAISEVGVRAFNLIVDSGIDFFKFLLTKITTDFENTWKSVYRFALVLFINPLINASTIGIKKIAGLFDAILPDDWIQEINDLADSISTIDLPELSPPSAESVQAWDNLVQTTKEGFSNVGEGVLDGLDIIGSSYLDNLIETFNVSEENQEKLRGLFGEVQQVIDETANSVSEATEEVVEFAEETVKQEPKVIGFWQNVGNAINNNVRTAVDAYRESLGTIETQIQDFTQTILTSLEGGVSEAYRNLLFGSEDVKAAEEAIKKLEPLSEQIRNTFTDDLVDTPSDFLAVESIQARLQEVADDQRLPKNLQAYARNLISSFGLEAPTEIASQIDRLVKKLEDETGFIARMKAFGGSIKDSLVLGFQDATVQLLTAQTMKALLSIGEDAYAVIKDQGAKIFTFLAEEGFPKLLEYANKTYDFAINLVGDAFTKLSELGDEIANFTGKAYQFVVNQAGNAFDKLLELGGKLKVFGSNVYSFTINQAGNAFNKLSDLATTLGNYGRDIYYFTINQTGNALTKLGEIASSIAGFSGKTYQFAVDQLGNALSSIRETLGKITDVSGRVYKFVVDQIGNALMNIRETVGKISDISGKVYRFIVDQFGNALLNIRETVSKVKEISGRVYRFIVDQLGNALPNIRETVSKIQQISGKVYRFIVDQLGNGLKRITDTVSKIQDISGKVYRFIVDQIGNGYQKIIDTADKALDIGRRVYNFSVNQIGDGLEKIESILSKGADLATKSFNFSVNQLGNGLENLVEIGRRIDDISGGVFTATINIAGDALRETLDIGDELLDLTKKVFDVEVNLKTIGDGWKKFADLGLKTIDLVLEISESSMDKISDAFSILGDIGSKIKGNMSTVLMSAFLGAQIGSMFGPNGEIGGAIGAGLGQVFGSLSGTKLGGEIGAAIGGFAGGIIAKAFAAPSKAAAERFAEQVRLAQTEIAAAGGILEATQRPEFFEQVGFASQLIGIESFRDQLQIALGFTRQQFDDLFDLEDFVKLDVLRAAVEGGVGEGFLKMAAITREQFIQSLYESQLQAVDFFVPLTEEEQRRVFEQTSGADVVSTILRFSEAAQERAQIDPDFAAAISGRHGALVPGPPSRAVPAIVHGGERILSVAEQESMGGNVVNVSFTINGNGDREIQRMIASTLPQIENSIFKAMSKKARYGQISFDNRAVRTASQI